jgi:hypothetical protein
VPIECLDFETARGATGLRMVVAMDVPSPWGDAAKGSLHVKDIPWAAIALDSGSRASMTLTR